MRNDKNNTPEIHISNDKDHTPELLFNKIKRRVAGKWEDSDETLVRYVIDNIDQLKESTDEELAIKANNTVDNVHNLCHKLGYFGFNEFKRAVLQFHAIITNEYAPTGNKIPISDTIEILTQVIGSDLTQYLQHIDLPSLNKVVQIMSKYQDSLIISDDDTFLSACYLAQHLKAIRKNAVVLNHVNTKQSLINAAQKVDYLVFFLLNDSSTVIEAKAEQLKNLNKPLILFTTSANHKFIPLVSTTLLIAESSHMIGSRAHLSFQLNTFGLIDLLALLI